MKVDRDVIIALCKKYGPLLQLVSAIDGVKLLWALSGNESDFGQNAKPKHEREYCAWHIDGRPGAFSLAKQQADLFHEYGCLSCCSFGPTQVMAVNAFGYSPLELLADPGKCFEATTAFLNREILGRQHADSLEHIGDAYNSGNWRDSNVPRDYIVKLVANYAVAME